MHLSLKTEVLSPLLVQQSIHRAPNPCTESLWFHRDFCSWISLQAQSLKLSSFWGWVFFRKFEHSAFSYLWVCYGRKGNKFLSVYQHLHYYYLDEVASKIYWKTCKETFFPSEFADLWKLKHLQRQSSKGLILLNPASQFAQLLHSLLLESL